jgi:hypothetical protein
MSNKNETLTIPLEIQLKRGDYETLTEKIPDEKRKNTLSHYTNTFLSNYANGGILLKAPDVDYLEKVAGFPINEPRQIAELVEKAAMRKGGAHTFEITIDPAFISMLEEQAVWKGWTLQEVVTDLVAQAFDSGMIYNTLPGRQMAAFAPSERDEIAVLTGNNNFNGEDIVKLLRSYTKATASNKAA